MRITANQKQIIYLFYVKNKVDKDDKDKPLVLESLISGTIALKSENEQFVFLNETDIKEIIDVLSTVKVKKSNKKTIETAGNSTYMVNLKNTGYAMSYDLTLFLMLRKDEDTNQIIISPDFSDSIYVTDDLAIYNKVVELIERSKYDMSFKFFLEMAPEEDVIDSSSLTKFRRLRLQDVDLLDMLIGKTVEIALDKGIITSKTIIVDATHTKARYNQKSPKEFLKEKSKNVRKAVYQFDEDMKGKFPTKPTSNEVTEELDYCRQVVEIVETQSKVSQIPAIKEKLNVLKEVIEDYDIQLSYSSDPDARLGHKSADSSFFGYKTHIAMSDERIITAAVITTGEKSDGQYLKELIEKSQQTGMEVNTVIGDTAYSGKDNLQYVKTEHLQLISKLNPVITNGNGQRKTVFDFNKDAGMFICPAGHMAIRKARTGKKDQGRNQVTTFFYDIEKCKVCPMREGCYQEGAKSKSYSVSIKSTDHEEQAQFQETETFKELAKKRYKIEAKNSEIKNPHGYNTARSAGLFGMEIQGATTIFAVNLKRILKLLND